MKGLVFFRDGHTEEIIDYRKVDHNIYFETASTKYNRIRLPGGFGGYFFNKFTSDDRIIPILDILRIDLF